MFLIKMIDFDGSCVYLVVGGEALLFLRGILV